MIDLVNVSEAADVAIREALADLDDEGAVRLYGALEDIRVDEASGTLRSGVAVEHLDLLERLDELHDPGRHELWGSEYGPFLVPRFTQIRSDQGSAERATFFYTLSSGNPYQVVLSSSRVAR